MIEFNRTGPAVDQWAGIKIFDATDPKRVAPSLRHTQASSAWGVALGRDRHDSREPRWR